jgi:hypothetical protein
MIKTLRRLGVSSEIAYGAALFSIVASVGAWATSRSKEEAPAAKAERWGIFVGLWAPTFMEIGNALKVDEK